jgi:hypothetical protein
VSHRHRLPACVAIAISALAYAVGAFAQVQTDANRRALQVRPAAAAVASWPSKAKRWALVIGVDQYADPQITTLGGSSNDAKAIAGALVSHAGFPEDQVILLASDQPDDRKPTRGNILRRLSNLVGLAPKDGLLFLSFAGHGMERGNQAFLLPSDAQVSDDVDLLEQTAINVSQVKERIRKTGVQQVVLVLDACRNDPAGRSNIDNPLTPAYVRGFNFDVRNREVTAFATLYATAVGMRAYEYTEKRQGYFTWALVEGLTGAAANARGEVTLAGLLKHVQERVPKRVAADLGAGKAQRPFAEIGGYQADELVIAVASRATPVASNTAATPNLDPAAAFELTYWDTIKNSTDPEDFKSYLEKYPDGQFAALARRRSQVAGTAGRTTATSPSIRTDTPVPADADDRRRSVPLTTVYALGWRLASAEDIADRNGSAAAVEDELGRAREAALTIGLATDPIDAAIRTVRGSTSTRTQYEQLLTVRERIGATLNRDCRCGETVNLLVILTLGAQQAYLERTAYQNGTPEYLIAFLTYAIRYAQVGHLPTERLQDIDQRARAGTRPRDLYERLVSVRDQFVAALDKMCSC